MDLAFYYLTIAALWWALALAYSVLATVSLFVVGYVVYDVSLTIKERKQRRNGMH